MCLNHYNISVRNKQSNKLGQTLVSIQDHQHLEELHDVVV